MKVIFNKITTAILLALVLTANTFAQDADFLKTQELESFNQIELDMDTEVILLKSSRNHLTLVGELDYINSLKVSYKGDTLAINHNQETDPVLRRVVIEYKDINQLETKGNGTYYLHKVDEDELKVINSTAKLTLSGRIGNVSIFSEDGEIDATKLESNKMFAHMGEEATLHVPNQ